MEKNRKRIMELAAKIGELIDAAIAAGEDKEKVKDAELETFHLLREATAEYLELFEKAMNPVPDNARPALIAALDIMRRHIASSDPQAAGAADDIVKSTDALMITYDYPYEEAVADEL